MSGGSARSSEPDNAPTAFQLLAAIWQRVLGVSSVRADDNFFDLGGESASAISLFAEIARLTNRRLPPTTIYQAPTLAALAALLEQPDTPSFLPLVPLKHGTEGPPIFVAHGLGSIRELFHVVRRLELPYPVHGMQVKGIDGISQPLESVESMADVYLDAIRQVQPHGPYSLVGYSFGGLVALEVAQCLVARGERVGLLAMVDSYPHRRFLPLAHRARLLARLAGHRASGSLGRIASGHGPAGTGKEELYCPPGSATFAPAMQRIRESADLALMRYQPRYYPGRIVFVKAQVRTKFPEDPAAFWKPLASKFELETVPGDHVGMLTTHAAEVASVLARHLKGALCRQ